MHVCVCAFKCVCRYMDLGLCIYACVCACMSMYVLFLFSWPALLSVEGAMPQAWLSGEGTMSTILPPLGLPAWKQVLSTGGAHALRDYAVHDQVWGCRLM